ncbi:MAG: bifunctional phosphopantothenoylcysteine decarboxylase/phosphopantothenate--cysteine ligase CoaBC [Myxococcales bacterium]|nr:bifunctional phosphopantothenoylcysteine decarboxylase/phosphopantothenate--cysteine ligase CoaBC [Myxococcales bacterium]
MGLTGKQIVVGIGGGIAAFKVVELVRELGRRGAAVRVVMTQAATQFVGPITFAGITGHPAVTDLWDPEYAGEVHVDLGGWADAMVVAPATANLIARAAHGLADDAVLATFTCTEAPVFMAPAMHPIMWNRETTRDHVTTLEGRGVRFLGPTEGPLASGETGQGRMWEPTEIADALEGGLSPEGAFVGQTVLITAGPTEEAIDPVRFLSNRSSGRMGYALARAARDRGAKVILVTGPTALPEPTGLHEVVRVTTAVEMHDAVTARIARCDGAIFCAAVADYRPAEVAPEKIKKGDDTMTLTLVRNPDILASVGAARRGARPWIVGFALESEHLVQNARAKLQTKGADLIVANPSQTAFGGALNRATLVTAKGEEQLPEMSKDALAHAILARMEGPPAP